MFHVRKGCKGEKVLVLCWNQESFIVMNVCRSNLENFQPRNVKERSITRLLFGISLKFFFQTLLTSSSSSSSSCPYASSFLPAQRHLQDLTTMLDSCSTRGVRPMKYMMVRGSRSCGTQQGEAEASGFNLLYSGRIML